MKIALIGPKGYGGGAVRFRAVETYLLSKNYDVNVYYSNFIMESIFNKIMRHLNKTKLNEQIINNLEKEIKRKRFDVIIAIENMDILLKDFNSLKIFFCEAPAADEYYFALAHGHRFAYGLSLEDIKELRKKEIEVFEKSDYVVFPWECYETYIRRYIYNEKNLLTIRFGCEPQEKTVSYFFPPSIVYLGALERYWNNMDLLSHLTSSTPYIIDVYGKPEPNSKYNLRYKGYSPSLDVFYNYQFGLNTVSKEILRRNAFSSKILSYLAYGLPCLFPEWQIFPHELGGCIPYNEDNFWEIVEKYSEKDEWQRLSKEAIAQAEDLRWDKVLKPLIELIKRG